VIRGARIAAASTSWRAEPVLDDAVLADAVLADVVLPLAGWPCTEPHAARKTSAAAARPMTAGRPKGPDAGSIAESYTGGQPEMPVIRILPAVDNQAGPRGC